MILAFRQCDAERMGIGQSALKFIKDGIKSGNEVIPNTPAISRLIREMSYNKITHPKSLLFPTIANKNVDISRDLVLQYL